MQKQVFQTNSATRWNSFIWFIRILVVFLLVISSSVVISLSNKQEYDLKVLTYNAKKLPDLNGDNSLSYISKEEQIDFANQLVKFKKNHRQFVLKKGKEENNNVNANNSFLPVNAAFYVNWDLNSLNSLKKNINQLNMVLPEWLFQVGSKGKIAVKTEQETLDFIIKHKVSVLPMLSNFQGKSFNGDSTLALLRNKHSRKHLIQQIKNVLDSNEMKGINIDFENLPKATRPYLIQFSKELYASLHPDGYLTTIDIDPTIRCVSYKEIAPYYDYIFLMAYNEHCPTDEPGSISSLNFIERAMDEAMKEVSSQKIVLCIAGYGFDWEKGKIGTKISYQGMVSLAKGHDADVNFNLSQSDVVMLYTDDAGNEHEAHCNDMAGTFNILRTANDYDAGGVALWYLGSEDERIWKFYSKDLDEENLKKSPFKIKDLEHISSLPSVNYDGKGEILEMMNEPIDGHSKLSFDTVDQLITEESYTTLPSSYMLKRFGAKNPKRIAITFDDGPNSDYTPAILDILRAYKIPATFFVTGMNIENNIPLIKRVYNEGHEIGNHTFTHPNLEITSANRERIELRSTRLLLETILHRSTLLFRPPYNTDAEPKNVLQIRPLTVAKDEGYISVTSYIDPNDWEEGISADSIVARAVSNRNMGNIMLLHDAGGDRSETILALPRIIEAYKKLGYEFVTVSALMGKTRDQVMPPVEKKLQFSQFLDLMFFTITYLWQNFIHGFFIIAIILIILRLLSLAVLAIFQKRREKDQPSVVENYHPKISIIVPAYNEEMNATRTIKYLLASDYSDFDIVFVDDGSKDETLARVESAYGQHPNVRILTKPNGGKASALNFGIQQASGEILVCIDADTMLAPDAVSKMVVLFSDSNIGAVAGNVRVGNARNTLTNWQSIEYTTSQNFERRAFDYLNAILVIPGAIGAFRKSALEEIKGFTTDTLAEDCDLTVRLLRANYSIRSCNEALAFTEAPESLSMFIKQRTRWTFGMMQSFWKHRDLLFNSRQANIGWIILPNLLIYNFIIPLFSPVVDIMFIGGLFSYNAAEYTFFYFLYYFIDCIISILAYKLDKRKFKLKHALYLFVQRFVYRQLLFVVLLKAFLKAMKGELVLWGVLKRTGNIED